MSGFYCFKVKCICTNTSKDTVSTGVDEDSPAEHYLDCVDGVIYVKAKKVSDVERLIGPNILSVEKIGICY